MEESPRLRDLETPINLLGRHIQLLVVYRPKEVSVLLPQFNFIRRVVPLREVPLFLPHLLLLGFLLLQLVSLVPCRLLHRLWLAFQLLHQSQLMADLVLRLPIHNLVCKGVPLVKVRLCLLVQTSSSNNNKALVVWWRSMQLHSVIRGSCGQLSMPFLVHHRCMQSHVCRWAL